MGCCSSKDNRAPSGGSGKTGQRSQEIIRMVPAAAMRERSPPKTRSPPRSPPRSSPPRSSPPRSPPVAPLATTKVPPYQIGTRLSPIESSMSGRSMSSSVRSTRNSGRSVRSTSSFRTTSSHSLTSSSGRSGSSKGASRVYRGY